MELTGRDDALGAEEPALRGLWAGILVYRWIALVWMVTLAATSSSFRSAIGAWALIGGTVAWNVWWSLARGWTNPVARWVDLTISLALITLSGVVQERGGVVGDHPFFATAYPVSSAMTFGAADGPAAGLASALALSIGLALSRPLNGVSLFDCPPARSPASATASSTTSRQGPRSDSSRGRCADPPPDPSRGGDGCLRASARTLSGVSRTPDPDTILSARARDGKEPRANRGARIGGRPARDDAGGNGRCER
jgi:hypothetical protein